MEYRYREDWGARPARRPAADLEPSKVTHLFVHHTTGDGGDDSAAWLRGIQRFHQETRGWADIGYCWIVDRHGVIWEGRGNKVGAHTAGWNSRAVAIAYLGDGARPIPEAALRAIRYQAETLDRIYRRPLIRGGHRDVGKTACPGDLLYAWVREGMPLERPEALPVPTEPAPRPSPVPDLREGWRRYLRRYR